MRRVAAAWGVVAAFAAVVALAQVSGGGAVSGIPSNLKLQSLTTTGTIAAGGAITSGGTAVSLSGHVHSGGEITTGTVADARLSSNVALRGATNAFTGTNTFSNDVVLLAARPINLNNSGNTFNASIRNGGGSGTNITMAVGGSDVVIIDGSGGAVFTGNVSAANIATGSFTISSFTGFTSSPSVPFAWARAGSVATVCAETGGTSGSNATFFGAPAGSLPAAIRPASNRTVPVAIQNNSVNAMGSVSINTDGSLTFGTGVAGGTSSFTAAGNKGLLSTCFSYVLN